MGRKKNEIVNDIRIEMMTLSVKLHDAFLKDPNGKPDRELLNGNIIRDFATRLDDAFIRSINQVCKVCEVAHNEGKLRGELLEQAGYWESRLEKQAGVMADTASQNVKLRHILKHLLDLDMDAASAMAVQEAVWVAQQEAKDNGVIV